jgi:hypothetical protein
VVLYLCKSVGALIYTSAAAPFIGLASIKSQSRVALLLACLALCYPALRAAELFPSQALLDLSSSFSAERAQSLGTRFEQEEALLNKAWQRPVFGWGRFGRNRVLVEDWQGIGVDRSITDGRWIITFGQFGLIGFVAEFGLLALPVFVACVAFRRVRSRVDALFLSTLNLILAINIVDLLPNSGLTPITWLLAGAVLGGAEAVKQNVVQLQSHGGLVWKPGDRLRSS